MEKIKSEKYEIYVMIVLPRLFLSAFFSPSIGEAGMNLRADYSPSRNL